MIEYHLDVESYFNDGVMFTEPIGTLTTTPPDPPCGELREKCKEWSSPPTGYIMKQSRADVYCTGSTCVESIDKDHCLQQKCNAEVNANFCPPGYPE